MLDLPPCVDQISATYQVPVNLIAAIRLQERGCPGQKVGPNKNGTWDLGPMGINSWWFEEHSRSLTKHGISAESVLNDFCQNLAVGTWILRVNYDSYGQNWADAISAFNKGKPDRKAQYLDKVLEKLKGVNHHNVKICGEDHD